MSRFAWLSLGAIALGCASPPLMEPVPPPLAPSPTSTTAAKTHQTAARPTATAEAKSAPQPVYAAYPATPSTPSTTLKPGDLAKRCTAKRRTLGPRQPPLWRTYDNHGLHFSDGAGIAMWIGPQGKLRIRGLTAAGAETKALDVTMPAGVWALARTTVYQGLLFAVLEEHDAKGVALVAVDPKLAALRHGPFELELGEAGLAALFFDPNHAIRILALGSGQRGRWLEVKLSSEGVSQTHSDLPALHGLDWTEPILVDGRHAWISSVWDQDLFLLTQAGGVERLSEAEVVRRKIPAKVMGVSPFPVSVLDPQEVPWDEPMPIPAGVAWCDADVALRRGHVGSAYEPFCEDDDDDDCADEEAAGDGDDHDETDWQAPPPPPAPGKGIRLSCFTRGARINTTYVLDPTVREIRKTARHGGYEHVMVDAVVGKRHEVRLVTFDCRAKKP